MSFSKREVSGLLFLSNEIKKSFKKENILHRAKMKRKIYDELSPLGKEETGMTTIDRLLNFQKVPNNIGEVSINYIVTWFSKSKLERNDIRTLDLFLKRIHTDFEEFKKSKTYIDFFKKWDETDFKNSDNSYDFPIKEVEAFRQKNKKNDESNGEVRSENKKINTLEQNISYLEKQLSGLEAQNLQAVLDEEFYMEIRNYINLFGNNRLKPVLRNIMSNRLRAMNLKLDKAKKLHESIGTAGLLFISVPNKEGLIRSIQKEFRGKLVKLYKEEY